MGQLVAGPLALVGKLAALALAGQLAPLRVGSEKGEEPTAQVVASPSAWVRSRRGRGRRLWASCALSNVGAAFAFGPGDGPAADAAAADAC